MRMDNSPIKISFKIFCKKIRESPKLGKIKLKKIECFRLSSNNQNE